MTARIVVPFTPPPEIPVTIATYRQLGFKWLLYHMPALDMQARDLFTTIGTVTDLTTDPLPDINNGLIIPGAIFPHTEAVTFSGGKSASTAYPIGSLTSVTVLRAKDMRGNSVMPSISAVYGSLISDIEFVGAVQITYNASYSLLHYNPEQEGGTFIFRYGTIVSVNPVTAASYTFDVPAVNFSVTGRILIYEVLTDVLAGTGENSGDALFDAWEKPVGWPDTTGFGGGLPDAPAEADCATVRRVHESGFLDAGVWRREIRQVEFEQPFKPAAGWISPGSVGFDIFTPEFKFRKTAAPNNGDLADVYNDLDWNDIQAALEDDWPGITGF